ncbi:MAG: hypothetical protein ACSW8F_01310 [bacterium]
MAKKTNELIYKGKPLRRKGNILYYGSMAEKYIVMLQVNETKPVGDLAVASKVMIQLQLTDPELKSRDRVVRKAERDGLYTALDVGAIWLSRALSAG